MGEMRYNKGDEEKLIKKYYKKTIQIFNKGGISKDVYEGTTGLLDSGEERVRAEHRISSASVKPRAEAPRKNLVVRNAYGKRIKEKKKVAYYRHQKRGAGRSILQNLGRVKEKEEKGEEITSAF